MEAKAIIFWGKGNTHKVCPKFYSYTFILFFQGSKQNFGQTGVDTEAFSVGWRYGAEEDSVGKVRVGVSIKGERRNWN